MAKQDFWWSVSNPSSLSNYFFPSGFGTLFFFLAKPFLVQLGILFAACCSHGTTPPNNSGLSKQKWHLGLYDHHSTFISIPERRFPIKFQGGLLAPSDSKASDLRAKSRYLDKTLFAYITSLDIGVYSCIHPGRSDFDLRADQIHLHCTYIWQMLLDVALLSPR